MKTVHARTLGLRIAALAAAGLVLTACNEDDAATGATGQTSPSAVASAPASAKASGKAKEPVKPSAHASGGSGSDAGAQARTNKLVLNAADWGAGFESNGDDDTSLTGYAMDKSCVLKEDGTVKMLAASTSRYVRVATSDGSELWGNSSASQFTTAEAAHQDMAESAADIKRCPDSKGEDGTETKTAHDIESPKVPGADEVYSEEGLTVYHEKDGTPYDPRPFSYIVARKGAVTVSVFVDLSPNQQVFEGRAKARQLLQKMTAKW
ncbi:hypothetical protein ACFYS8_31180 [Kitasatospora sp. NPDC004615]|uniref:hypothetical protein n=1 Tax=Kitasatospora sp. NPDC004615 TaxID=3364017 RepID=UPI003698EC2F